MTVSSNNDDRLRYSLTLFVVASAIGIAIILSTSTSKLEQMDTHYKVVMNSTFEAVIVCNEYGKVQFASDNIEDLFGYKARYVYENGFDYMMSDEVNERHHEAFLGAVAQAKRSYAYSATPMRRVVDVKCADGSTVKCGIRMLTRQNGKEVFLYAFIIPIGFSEAMNSWPKAAD